MAYLDKDARDLLEKLRRESLENYVPLIDAEDGAALASLAFLAPRGVMADLGAGIGYSTLWLALGARGREDKEFIKIVAVEWDPDLAESLHRNVRVIERVTGVKVEVVNMDALEYLDKLPEGVVFSLVFVDVEKTQYPTVFKKIQPRIVKGGLLAFHNAYFPPPPKSFYELIRKYNHVIVPTPQGLAIIKI